MSGQGIQVAAHVRYPALISKTEMVCKLIAINKIYIKVPFPHHPGGRYMQGSPHGLDLGLGQFFIKNRILFWRRKLLILENSKL